MRTKDVADWLNISTSTVKGWSRDFAEFLSDAAAGRAGQYRYFGPRDCEVMAFIAEQRQENKSLEEIRAALAELQAGDFAELPPIDIQPTSAPVSMVPELASQTAIEQQRQRYDLIIAGKDERIGELQDDLNIERAAHSDTRNRLNEEIRQRGLAEGKLSIMPVYRRLLIAAAVVALALLAVVVVMALSGGA